jgi:hypothetical protein
VLGRLSLRSRCYANVHGHVHYIHASMYMINPRI